MVVIGVDSHKRTHTVVATDATGRKLAHVHRRTERPDLLRAGERVIRVQPKLMAGARRSSRLGSGAMRG